MGVTGVQARVTTAGGTSRTLQGRALSGRSSAEGGVSDGVPAVGAGQVFLGGVSAGLRVGQLVAVAVAGRAGVEVDGALDVRVHSVRAVVIDQQRVLVSEEADVVENRPVGVEVRGHAWLPSP